MSETEDGKRFRLGEYDVEIIVHGFPGKSVCHGSLGFSTIALIRWREQVALIDVGSFGQRALLIEQLAHRSLAPEDVTHVLLTHSHYDHAINWVLFPEAQIVIGRDELDWSVTMPWGRSVVPELYMRELQSWPTLCAVAHGDEVFAGISAHVTPGHTPGSLVYVLDTGDRDLVFTGDACKNRAELLSRAADMSYDADVTKASIEHIWQLWMRRDGGVLVPGHDLPMVHDDGVPRYLGQREAAIKAWYGEGLDETTVISLLAP